MQLMLVSSIFMTQFPIISKKNLDMIEKTHVPKLGFH